MNEGTTVAATANPQRKLFLLLLIIGSVLCIGIYGFNFDSMSEESMMSVAYFWVFFLVTGVSGLLMKNNPKPLGKALMFGGLSMLLLFVFYVVIFPSL